MAKYVFPAILHIEDSGYFVEFPDIENCFTQGKTLIEALEMAEDVLCLMLMHMEDKGETIPESSNPTDLTVSDGEQVALIKADTTVYRRATSERAVKKTLTIPSWLNEAAEAQSINFSQVLQEALKARLQHF